MSSEKPRFIPKKDPYDEHLAASVEEVKEAAEHIGEDLYSFYSRDDWLTFLAQNQLSSAIDSKMQDQGLDNPLSILLMTVVSIKDSKQDREAKERDFFELCSDSKLTTVERLALKSALQLFTKNQDVIFKENKIRKQSFIDRRAIHILTPQVAKDNWDEDMRETLHFAMLGPPQAGKTSMVRRLVSDTFEDSIYTPTVGLDFSSLYVASDPEGKQYKIAHLIIADTGGQDRFRQSMTDQYFRGKDAFIFVYDVCDEESFEQIEKWHSDMEERVDKEDVIRVLVGNKTDLLFDQTKFTTEDTGRIREKAADLAARLGMTLFEVSSKSGQNVVDMVVETVKQVFDHRRRIPSKSFRGSGRKSTINLEDSMTSEPKPKRSCCASTTTS